MENVVIDASVFVAIIAEEQYSGSARAIRDDYVNGNIHVIVPSLFPYEVLNAAKCSKGYGQKELESLAGFIDDYEFTVVDLLGNFSSEAVKAAARYDITIYDAAYVALASILGAVLYTADEKLIKAVKTDFVRHLTEFNRGRV